MPQVTWSAPTSITTGISAGSLNAGANLLGSEYDNETQQYRWAMATLTWTCSTASTAHEVVELYLIYATDGTNYEDGGTSVDPYKAPVATFKDDGGTGAQKQTAQVLIPLGPFKFKPLIKSELTNNATLVTLEIEVFNEDPQSS